MCRYHEIKLLFYYLCHDRKFWSYRPPLFCIIPHNFPAKSLQKMYNTENTWKKIRKHYIRSLVFSENAKLFESLRLLWLVEHSYEYMKQDKLNETNGIFETVSSPSQSRSSSQSYSGLLSSVSWVNAELCRLNVSDRHQTQFLSQTPSASYRCLNQASSCVVSYCQRGPGLHLYTLLFRHRKRTCHTPHATWPARLLPVIQPSHGPSTH